MKLKNQTCDELIEEYKRKYYSIYNAMVQITSTNPYADTTKFIQTLVRLNTLISLYKSTKEINNDY